MALKLPSRNDTFRVVLRIDSALGDNADYEAYLKSLDESHLDLREEPTRIVMRNVLPLRLYRKVQDEQVEYKDGGVKINSSFTSEEVRCSIVGIENPPHLGADDKVEFKAAGDGGASEDLIAQFAAAGVIYDLYQARQTAVGSKADQDKLKKK